MNLSEKLLKNGFVILDLINVDEVDYLNSLCHQYLKTQQQDFVSGSHFLPKEDADFINQELHRIIKPKTDVLFPELELLGGTLATKIQGKSVLKAHNDWDIVDEKLYNSYNLWLPLVSTNQQNGTLGLIPNSHAWKHTHRGFNIDGRFENFTNEFIKIGIEPELKAGQAILYNHRLIHFSRPNTTSQPRNVAIIGMKDKAATLQISLSVEPQIIETYQAEQADFYQFDVEKIRKNNKLIAKENYKKSKEKFSDFYAEFEQHLSEDFSYLKTKKATWFEQLKQLIGLN